jgi:small subunit ribosomal protein S20
MANIKSAKKRAKTNIIRRTKNIARQSEIKTITHKFLDAIGKQDLTTAKDLLKNAESKLARAKNKSVIKKNTASRKISRLAKKLYQAQKEKK